MLSHTRISQRTSPAHLGFIQIFGDDGGRILNISESGLSFESFAPLGESKTLQFWFSLNLRDRIEAMGQVVWLDAGTKIGGLRFLNPSDRVVEHIRRYSKAPRPNGSPQRGALFANVLAKQKVTEASNATSQTLYKLSPQPGFDSTELISWQRHREECRKRFTLGLIVGLFVASTATAAVYRFWAPRTPRAATINSSQPLSLNQNRSEEAPACASVPQAVSASPKRSPVLASRVRSLNSANEPKAGRLLPTAGTLGKETVPIPKEPAGPPPQTQNSPKKMASLQQLWSEVQAGDTKAAVVLADHYLRGDGVPANCLQARVLLLVASEKKNADAIKKLDELDKTGCPVDPRP